MQRKMFARVLALLPVLLASVAVSQDTTPAQDFEKVPPTYYSLTANGLKSFRCDVGFDWAAFLRQSKHSPVTAESPLSKYLKTVHLSIVDDLRGQGKMLWQTSATPSAEDADYVQMLQAAIPGSWGGFFQSWNAYMNGSMISTAGGQMQVERTNTGFYLKAQTDQILVEKEFAKDLLTAIHVKTANMDIRVYPTYADTPQGRVIQAFHSTSVATAASPTSDSLISIKYGNVDGFYLPSNVHIVANKTVSWDFQVTNCQVSK